MNGFLPPDTTELPTLAACQGLRTAAGGNLNMARIDIECACFRNASPPGLSELTVLPPIRRAYLVANCPEVDVGSSELTTGEPSIDRPSHGVELEALFLWPWVLTVLRQYTIVKSCKVSSRQESAGLRCKGAEESSDQQRFFGLVFYLQRGRISLSHRKLVEASA